MSEITLDIKNFPPGCSSSCAPAIAEHLSDLWCVWSQEPDQALTYWKMDTRTLAWETPQTIRRINSKNPLLESDTVLQSSGTPALIDVAGVLHLVYKEASHSQQLMHLYWEDDSFDGVWIGRYAMLGALTIGIPALADFGGMLFCVFTLGSRGLLFYCIHSKLGWSDVSQILNLDLGSRGIVHQLSMYTLDNALHLYFAESGAASNNVSTASYNIVSGWKMGRKGVAGTGSDLGASAASSPGAERAILAFIPRNVASSKEGTITLCEKEAKAAVWGPSISTNCRAISAPAITVIGNWTYIAWNNLSSDGGRSHKTLYWAKRSLVHHLRLESWMSKIPDDTWLSDIFIPGTHDSGTAGILPLLCCQTLSIKQQLWAGVRYFDLHGKLDLTAKGGDKILICHGDSFANRWPTWPSLGEVFQTMYQFLEEQNSEVLIVQIKQDCSVNNDFNIYADTVRDIVATNKSVWCLSNQVTSIGEMRSSRQRIQLFRRFRMPSNERHYGICWETLLPGRMATTSLP